MPDSLVEGWGKLVDDDAMQGRRADPTADAIPFRGRLRVICASTDAELQREVADALADNFEVIGVPDGAAAVRAAREHLPELVLSDVESARIDGVALRATLGADPRTSSMPVMFIVAQADAGRRYDDLAASPDDYLVRPFTATELAASVHHHIVLRQTQRAWAIERERAARQLSDTDQDELRTAAREVPLFSHVERCALEREVVDLTALARQVTADLSARDPARMVDVQVSDGLTAVGDRALVTIVVEQLLGNAWKFTSTRTHAEIVVESQHAGVFVVRDNGVGFDMAQSDDLFRPYRRLHPSADFAGVGIGLAIVRRIVERHGGEAWAHGIVDGGATVWFTLGPDSEPPATGVR